MLRTHAAHGREARPRCIRAWHVGCFGRGGAAAGMSIILEREVVVVSDDGEVQREVSAVVARHPGAHAVLGGPDGLRRAGSRREARIVVLDDTARRDALELLRDVKREPGDAAVVYLASDHSTALEGAVRRAGASFYCIKAARDGQLARVIDALLGQRD